MTEKTRLKVDKNVQENFDWRRFNAVHQGGGAGELTLQGEAVGMGLAQLPARNTLGHLVAPQCLRGGDNSALQEEERQ